MRWPKMRNAMKVAHWTKWGGVNRSYRVHHVDFESLAPGFLGSFDSERANVGYQDVQPTKLAGGVGQP